jgi:hypothetical protein
VTVRRWTRRSPGTARRSTSPSASSRYPRAGVPLEDLLSLIDANETQIEAAGVNVHSYVAPGDDHTALTDGRIYTESLNGVNVVDWVTSLIDGEPADDVHCTECTAA